MTAPSSNPQDTMSAADFFQQDDSALAAVLLPKKEEPLPEPKVVSAPKLPVEPQVVEEQPPLEAPIIDEGAETPKAEPEARPLMTQFKLYDNDGELEIPTDVEVELKANGKLHKLPLDHVVRLAQFGFSNKEREEQVTAAKRFVAESQQVQQEYQQAIQNYETNIERLLADPVYYEEVRAQYSQQNTPEAQLARTQQQLNAVRANQQEQTQQQTVQAFVQTVLVPTTEQLLKANPTVTETELIGQYTKLTAPLLVRGRVPVQRLPEVQALVERDLAEWAQATHLERAAVKRTAEQQAGKATREAAIAKRAVAQKLAAPGTTPGLQPNQAPKKFDTAKDWLNSTFGTPED